MFGYSEKATKFEKIFHLEFDATLDSGINIGDLFPGATFLIREGNAYLFSKYLLFDGMGDVYFKGYT